MQRATAFFIQEDGLPVLCELVVRESTTAPSRLKVAFAATIEEGAQLMVPEESDPMPLPDGFEGKGLLAPEFRIELN